MSNCNYNKSTEALELHHMNSTQKSFSISTIMAHPTKWEFIAKEASKCILLCANCHREVHAGVSILPKTFQIFDESLIPTDKKVDECPVCKAEKPITQKFCSLRCAGKSRFKIDWNTIDLIDLIDNQKISKTQIAKTLNCSDVIVGKKYREQSKNVNNAPCSDSRE